MSLLMDALRKAEAAKNKADGKETDESSNLSLEPQDKIDSQQAITSPSEDVPSSTEPEEAQPDTSEPKLDPGDIEPENKAETETPEIEQVTFELESRPESEAATGSEGDQADIAEAPQTTAEIADELLRDDSSDESFDLTMESPDEIDSIIPEPEFIEPLDHSSDKTQEETLEVLDQKIGGADELSGYIPEESLQESSDDTFDNEFKPQEAEEELTQFERSLHHTETDDDSSPDQAVIDRQTANSLFQAKQNSQHNKRNRIIMLGLLIALLPIGGGGFYWYYSSSMSNSMFPANASITPPPQGFLGDGTVAEAAPDTPVTSDTTDSTAMIETEEPVNANINTEATVALLETEANEETETTEATADSNEANIPDSSSDSLPAAASPPATIAENNQTDQTSPVSTNDSVGSSAVEIRLTRTTSRPTVNPDLLAAYESYQQGNLEQARRLYAQVLETQANNRDALLGLAMINRQEGDIGQAQAMYSRLLQLNPRDPLARAGLLESGQNTSPSRQESQLRALQNEYPDVAPLAFALGNLFASQSRWNEAQNAYFDALLIANEVGSNSISPDYAFNLAVSLERLNQLDLAYSYYQEALDLSSSSPAGFNMDNLNQRMAYLEEVLQ